MSTLEEVFLRLAEIDHANDNPEQTEGGKGLRAGGGGGGAATGGLGHVTQEEANSLAQVAVPVEDVWAELESFQCKKSALRQVDPLCPSLNLMCVCFCVCVCVFVCLCVCVCTKLNIYIYIYIYCVCVCMWIYLHIACVYVCVYTYILRVCMYVYTPTYYVCVGQVCC